MKSSQRKLCLLKGASEAASNMPYSPPPPWVLPTLTALIGSGGFIVGVYSFISPLKAARVYGVELPVSNKASQHSLKGAVQRPTPSGVVSATDIKPRHVAYIYAHGIRNFVTGATVLSLTYFWQFSRLCRESDAARTAAQKCLGTVILLGTLTPVVDAFATWHAAEEGIEADVGRKAARLHASRSLIWLVGGLWCLSGH